MKLLRWSGEKQARMKKCSLLGSERKKFRPMKIYQQCREYLDSVLKDNDDVQAVKQCQKNTEHMTYVRKQED